MRTFVVGFVVASAFMNWGDDQQPKSIHIAMAHSFVVGKSEAVVNIAKDDFKNVLKVTTGFDGDLTTALNAFEVADKLDKKQIDFGIFHGHEFAWVQSKHP